MTRQGENSEPVSETGKKIEERQEGAAALVAFVQNEEKVSEGLRPLARRIFTGLVLDCVMGGGEEVPPAFKKQQDAIQRFRDQVDSLVKDGTLKPGEGTSLKKLGDAFVTGNPPKVAQAVRELASLRGEGKDKVLEAFGKIVSDNTGDKPDAKVTFKLRGDKLVFEGKEAIGEKRQLRISLKDTSFDFTNADGDSLDIAPAKKQEAFKRFIALTQDRFSERLEVKKPADEKPHLSGGDHLAAANRLRDLYRIVSPKKFMERFKELEDELKDKGKLSEKDTQELGRMRVLKIEYDACNLFRENNKWDQVARTQYIKARKEGVSGEDLDALVKRLSDDVDHKKVPGDLLAKEKAPKSKEDWAALVEKQLKIVLPGEVDTRGLCLAAFKNQYDRVRKDEVLEKLQAAYDKEVSDNPKVAEINRAKALMDLVKAGLIVDRKIPLGKVEEIPALSSDQLEILKNAK